MAKATLFGRNGRHEINIDEKVYEKAHDAKCSVPQFLEREYGKDLEAKEHGTVFAQLLAQCNMNLSKDPATGLGSATLDSIYKGTGPAAAVTRDAVPLSRILMPAAVLELMELNRLADQTSDIRAFESMLAVDTSISGNRYEQPVFDASGADNQELSRIDQLQVPNIIGSLKVADRAGSIPTYSYGVEISDEAVKAMTIDQVAIYLSRMSSVQAALQVDMQLNALVQGDKDVGQAALTGKTSDKFDAASTGGTLTHRAYVKWLRENRRRRNVTHVLCDEETYFKIVDRKGRPTAQTLYVEDKEIHAYPQRVMNYGFQEPEIFIVNDGVIPTDTLVGLDKNFAIARIRNTEANYQATEELVMRKGKQMRFDSGSVTYRLDDTAWTVMTIKN